MIEANCQKIDNTASQRDPFSDSYFRIHYDNDLFLGQDANYTQGYSFELVTPELSQNPIDRLLINLNNDHRLTGVAFEHLGFTPKNYGSKTIQRDDRPFAAVAMLKSFSISVNKTSGQRLVSYFSFGVMGPVALGEEIQVGIHKMTGDEIPQGWKNQISNQMLFNYGVEYEKEFLKWENYFVMYGNTSANLGNLYSNLTLGLNTKFGLLNSSYFSSRDRKYMVYGFVQPTMIVVGYDGTLQGAMSNSRSVHTITSRNINRIIGQLNYGIVMQTNRFYLEYSITRISPEIKTLSAAGWGSLKLGVRI